MCAKRVTVLVDDCKIVFPYDEKQVFNPNAKKCRIVREGVYEVVESFDGKGYFVGEFHECINYMRKNKELSLCLVNLIGVFYDTDLKYGNCTERVEFDIFHYCASSRLPRDIEDRLYGNM